MYKLILLDLDGTLLHSDRSISEYTLQILEKCKSMGILIGISTARGESNAKCFISKVKPEIVISSGGALVRYKDDYIFSSAFSAEEATTLINTSRLLTEGQCEITVDTQNGHYWNYKIDPLEMYPDWGEAIYTDYSDFNEVSLKLCVETADADIAQKIAMSIEDCNHARFSDCNWYKFTKADATKEKAIREISKVLGIAFKEIIAFGDDFVDIEMLKICGKGIAMENAIEEVKQIADDVTSSNDKDGVATYLEKHIIS